MSKARGRQKLHPATKTFLALRIAVNRDNGGTRAVSTLFAVLLCIPFVMAPSCGNWELAAYRTLAVTQVGYDNYYSVVAELCIRGVPSKQYCATAKSIAQRIYDLGKSTTALLASYAQIKDPATKSRIQAAVAELPKLVAELERLVRGIHPHEGEHKYGDGFDEAATSELLGRFDEELAVVEALR